MDLKMIGIPAGCAEGTTATRVRIFNWRLMPQRKAV